MQRIKILDELEHVRVRPHMYIGETTNPDHLVVEVLDNALDEVINGFGKKVSLDFLDDHTVRIRDDGSGLPEYEINFKGEKQPAVVFLCTKLFSGAKFDSDKYKKKVGQHGVGLTVVNALSEFLDVKTREHQYHFEKTKLKSVKDSDLDEEWSTEITFKPDKKIFESLNFTASKFRDRFTLLAATTEDAEFYLNGEKIDKIPVEQFVRSQLKVDEETPIFQIKKSSKVAESQRADVTIYFTYDMRSEATLSPTLMGVVNMRKSQGTYLQTLMTGIATAFYELTARSDKYILQKEDFKTRFRMFAILEVNEPHFDSQTKDRYIGPKITDLANKLKDDVKKLYRENEYLQKAIEQINDYKIMRKANSKTKKNGSSRVRISVDSPLRACSKRPGKRLYIVEGPSAGNTLVRARDPKWEAVFPLQGKVINAESNRLDKVLSNKFVQYLLEAIGIKKLGEPFEPMFEEFAILADADCVAGDTEVWTLDRGPVPISELHEQYGGVLGKYEGRNIVVYNPKNYFWVWSVSPEGVMEPKRAYGVMKKATYTSYIKVRLDNDKVITVTPDHKLLMRDGTYKEAKDLSLTDHTMSMLGGQLETYSVKYIQHIENGEPVDFYDLIVEDNHNFATGAGCFVHNCDGIQISFLVALLIRRLAPSIINEGRLVVIQPPLYGAVKGKEFIPIYRVQDIHEYKEKGYSIHRFKGLGEMTERQMREVIRNGKKHVVKPSPEADKLIDQLFSSSEAKRKLLEIPSEEIERVLFGLS